jgi:hypothetical protein
MFALVKKLSDASVSRIIITNTVRAMVISRCSMARRQIGTFVVVETVAWPLGF